MHVRNTVRMIHWEQQRATMLVLGLAITLLVAACGQSTNRGGGPSVVGGKLSGAGTPVSGVPQVLGPATGGEYESVLASGGITYLGAGNGFVCAFQSSDGKLLWQRNLNGSVALSAAVDHVIYVEANGESSNTAYALDATGGAVLWRYTFPTPVADLAISGGAVFANDNYPSGTGGSTIYALRASDGSLLWRYTAPVAIPQSLEVAGDVVYAEAFAPSGTSQPSLYAVRAKDGKLLWTYQAAGELALPTVERGVAYLAVSNGPLNAVDAVDSATGARLWRFTPDADQNFTGRATVPTVVDGVVYVAASGMVYALRASDGHILWRASRANTEMPVAEWAVVGDGAVYFREGDSGLTAVRATDGTPLWHQHVGNIFGITEDHGLIQVITQSNAVYGLRASDGSVLWKQPIDNFVSWDRASLPYAFATGTFFVATEKGKLEAIRAADGALLWHYSAPPPQVLSAPVFEADVTFASSVPYEQALREVTDLGLAVGMLCQPPGVAWKPLRQGPVWFSRLIVDATPMSKPNWLTPLRALLGVSSVQPIGVMMCPDLHSAPPGTLATLAQGSAGTLVRMTFTGQTSYEAALDETINLGFRLTNPCYERLPQGAHVNWTPMGQEHDFAQSHVLLMLTTKLNSTAWQQQARNAASVTKVEVQPDVTCATP